MGEDFFQKREQYEQRQGDGPETEMVETEMVKV